jgi:hypothetical protein
MLASRASIHQLFMSSDPLSYMFFSGAPAPPTKTNELKSVHHAN